MWCLTRARRAAAALLAAGALAACADRVDVVEPPLLRGGSGALMRSYVALGNSITAGFQSDGINDSTQRRAYPALLAAAAGTRYAYPALAAPGCRAPIAAVLLPTPRRVGGVDETFCGLRTPASASAVLNNVAVPGATSFDPTGRAGGGYSPLTTLLLGGATQVQKAVQADPTFVTIWVGNNDVLGPALAGTTRGITPVPTFVQNYAAMVGELRAGSPNLRGGVLIGVLDVTNAPILIPIAALQTNAVLRLLVQRLLLGGRPVVFPGCAANTTALVSFVRLAELARQAASLPADATIPLACEPTTVPGFGEVGAANVVDPAERLSIVSTVAAYNAYIRAKADSIGFAYYDPNVRFLALRASGAIPVFPNLADPSQPFGPFVSNDGVHPGTAAHALVAQELVALINTTYGPRFGVELPPPPSVP